MENLATDLDARLAALWQVLARHDKRELNRTAASVLTTLRDRGARRITELAESEAIAQPSATTLVGRLERDGLVQRAPDPDDARAVRVHLTDAGLKRLAERRAARAVLLEARLARLTDDERAALTAALPVLDKMLEGTD
jgi:DNA-binding MarR family transcriptional regulator